MEQNITFFLFELGYSVVKVEGAQWYKRDKKNHQWMPESEWFHRYHSDYDAVEIDYDEEHESIIAKRRIPGWSSDWIEKELAE